MVVLKKNQIVTVAMAGLIILAGYLNYTFTDKKDLSEKPSVTASKENETEEIENYGEAQFVNASGDAKGDYFNEIKLNKEKSRSEAISLIKDVAESEEGDEEGKRKAQEEIISMAKNIEAEGNIENILMSKGFEKVSVYMGNGNVTVTVLTDGLKPEDVAKIRDVVIGETGVSADKIKIMEIK